MTISTIITVTGTGTTDLIDVGTPKRLTYTAYGTGGTDYAITPQVRVAKASSNVSDEDAIVDSDAVTTQGAISGIQFNVTSMGSATSIDIEVVGDRG